MSARWLNCQPARGRLRPERRTQRTQKEIADHAISLSLIPVLGDDKKQLDATSTGVHRGLFDCQPQGGAASIWRAGERQGPGAG